MSAFFRSFDRSILNGMSFGLVSVFSFPLLFHPSVYFSVVFDIKSFDGGGGAAAIDASSDGEKKRERPNQNFKVFGNRFPQMLHEFGGNQKFFYQNKVHNFSFLLFKALRFSV